ncbi:Tetratricopeptide repeat-containing protein [Planctomycetales bacterium 10988]|nr:Tetratricopeptide repeat-containing protein [Planctomycetales bacterium 10988]
MAEADKLYDEADELKEEGKLEEAVAKIEEALKIDPDHVLCHYAMAKYQSNLGNHDKAIEYGKKTLELDSQNTFAYTALSVIYRDAGKIPEAEDMLARSRMV